MVGPHLAAAVLLLLGLASCFRSHPDTAVEITAEQCAACHQADYDATDKPAHGASGYPTTCTDCHWTAGWQPALEGLHPEATFPIVASAHSGIACLECHDLDRHTGPGDAGADTVCAACHDQPTNDDIHELQPGYAYDATTPAFCLACHPAGIAEVKHIESNFPISHGRHHVKCGSCHVRSGGLDSVDNTNCINCHREAHHRDPSQPHNCVAAGCHPDGKVHEH